MNHESPQNHPNGPYPLVFLVHPQNMSGRNKSNFSIEHILNVAGNSKPKPECPQLTALNFDWLNCTRYRPPRIQSKFLFYCNFSHYLFGPQDQKRKRERNVGTLGEILGSLSRQLRWPYLKKNFSEPHTSAVMRSNRLLLVYSFLKQG